MPGKHSHLRNELERKVDQTSYGQLVEEKKQSILESSTKIDIAERIKTLKKRKDKIEEISKKIEFEMIANEKALVMFLESSQEESFKLTSGGSFFLSDKIYPSVEDKDKVYDWAIANGYKNALTMHWQTLLGICGDALANGQPIPDGVKVYLDLRIGTRNVR